MMKEKMQVVQESPYLFFDRKKWALLRDSEPMTLSEEDLNTLKGINEELSMDEVREIYLPLSRLIGFYVDAQLERQVLLNKFLQQERQNIPFVISIAGSVSVGKSTTARVLQALLSRKKEKKEVALITTDGFLYPNSILEKRGLMMKKGFPVSYDIKELIKFLHDIKSGMQNLKSPVYSHRIYDIIPEQFDIIRSPDILILEGLNVLQSGMDYPTKDKPRVFVSDYADFSIYVDAEEKILEEWYLSRFVKLRKDAVNDPDSYFYNFIKIPEKEALRMAKSVWREVNLKNLRKNILPTRERASLILHKVEKHVVDYVKLRK